MADVYLNESIDSRSLSESKNEYADCWVLVWSLSDKSKDDATFLHERPFCFRSFLHLSKVACGTQIAAFLTNDGQLYTWFMGSNPNALDATSPQLVEHPFVQTVHFVDVSCGDTHIGCVSDQGHLYMLGNNRYGQFGNGMRSQSDEIDNIPHHVPMQDKVEKVVCGSRFTLVISDQHELWGMGDSSSGVLLKSSTTPQHIPIHHQAVKRCSVSSNHALVITASGLLFSWGSNELGQLGLGHRTIKSTPHMVRALAHIEVVDVSAGSCSVALVSDGSIYFWGINNILSPSKLTTKSITKPMRQMFLSGDLLLKFFANGKTVVTNLSEAKLVEKPLLHEVLFDKISTSSRKIVAISLDSKHLQYFNNDVSNLKYSCSDWSDHCADDQLSSNECSTAENDSPANNSDQILISTSNHKTSFDQTYSPKENVLQSPQLSNRNEPAKNSALPKSTPLLSSIRAPTLLSAASDNAVKRSKNLKSSVSPKGENVIKHPKEDGKKVKKSVSNTTHGSRVQIIAESLKKVGLKSEKKGHSPTEDPSMTCSYPMSSHHKSHPIPFSYLPQHHIQNRNTQQPQHFASYPVGYPLQALHADHYHDIQPKYNEAQNIINKLQSDLASAREKLQQSELRNDTLTSNTSSLMNQMQNLMQQMTERDNKIKHLCDDNEKFHALQQRQQFELDKQAQQHHADLTELVQKLNETEQNRVSSTLELQESRRSYLNLKQDYDRVKIELNEIQNDLQAKQSESLRIEKERRSEIDNNMATITRLEGSLCQAMQKHFESDQTYADEIKKLKEKNSQLLKTVEELKDESLKAAQVLNNQNEKISALESDTQRKNIQIDNLTSEINDQKTKMKRDEEHYESAKQTQESEIKALKLNVQNFEKQLNLSEMTYNDEITRVVSEVESQYENDLTAFQKRITDLITENTMLTDNVASLRETFLCRDSSIMQNLFDADRLINEYRITLETMRNLELIDKYSLDVYKPPDKSNFDLSTFSQRWNDLFNILKGNCTISEQLTSSVNKLNSAAESCRSSEIEKMRKKLNEFKEQLDEKALDLEKFAQSAIENEQNAMDHIAMITLELQEKDASINLYKHELRQKEKLLRHFKKFETLPSTEEENLMNLNPFLSVVPSLVARPEAQKEYNEYQFSECSSQDLSHLNLNQLDIKREEGESEDFFKQEVASERLMETQIVEGTNTLQKPNASKSHRSHNTENPQTAISIRNNTAVRSRPKKVAHSQILVASQETSFESNNYPRTKDSLTNQKTSNPKNVEILCSETKQLHNTNKKATSKILQESLGGKSRHTLLYRQSLDSYGQRAGSNVLKSPIDQRKVRSNEKNPRAIQPKSFSPIEKKI